jgi:hypothetical protein
MYRKINYGLVGVAALALVQAALRLFFALGGSGLLGNEIRDQTMGLIEAPVADEMLMIVLPFFLIGLLGAITAVGLLLHRPWGFHGTIALSLATIAYDLWAVVEIQSSAALGIILPVIFILYLTVRKDVVLAPREVAA